jgi:protease PrsW
VLNYFIIVLYSFLPSIIWILAVRFIDRKNPEPHKELIKAFLGGCIIVLPVFILVQGAKYFLDQSGLPDFLYILLLSFMIDGFIEELGKFFILKDFVYHKSFFDEPLDGLVYGVTVAMGFAFVENIFYLAFNRPELIIMRFTTPTLMHALATGIVGYHLALAKFKNVSKSKKRWYIFLGLVLATLLHGLFNSVIRYNLFFNYIPLALLIVFSYIYLLRGLRKVQKINSSKAVSL